MRALPGRPDIVLPRFRAAVLIHGCFWHHHAGCKIAKTPKSNRPFWINKFRANVERDLRKLHDLEAAGWRAAIVWECGIRHHGPKAVADMLSCWLKSEEAVTEIADPTKPHGGP